MRFGIFTSLFFMLLIFHLDAWAKPGKKLSVEAQKINGFLLDKPEETQFGKLEFLGGLELKSDHEDFGGISGIRFVEGDAKFLAVTDKGKWISGTIERKGARPDAIKNARIGSLRKTNGKKLKGKKEGDSEGLEIFGDAFLISFERNHRVDRFSWEGEKLRQISGIQTIDLSGFALESNHGPEAIAYSTQSGNLFVFPEEDAVDEEFFRGFIIRDNFVEDVFVKRNGAYRFSDAAFDEIGRLYLLERHYSALTGVTIRIRQFDASDLKAKATLTGKTLFEANWKHQLDNMEGLAISQMEDGKTRLTLISDDNFSSGQRTLLLEFKLAD